jgi:4-hydroxy-tetrahydrodipicolinate synthase
VEEARQAHIPVLAGAGGYATAEVIELAKEVKAAGADGILSVTPYYSKPSQEGLYQHFKAIAAAVPIPIVVYSVQSRTAVNIEPATMKRLAEIDNIVGVKEASGNLAQVASILAQVPDRFNVLSGDDAVALPVIALGGRGLISTTSNEIPAEMAELVDTSRRGDLITARQILRRYLPLIEVNFIESNPIPVKAAMALMGLMEPVWRLPLVPPKPESQAKIEKVLTALGLMPVHAAS